MNGALHSEPLSIWGTCPESPGPVLRLGPLKSRHENSERGGGCLSTSPLGVTVTAPWDLGYPGCHPDQPSLL